MIAWWQPLLGVVAGWLLSQGTEVIRQKRRARKNRTAISAELRDIHSSTKLIIDETVEFIKTLQITKGVDLPTHNIVNQVFKTTFSDTLLEFTERERLILVRVHDAVDRINSMFSTIRLSDVYLGTEVDYGSLHAGGPLGKSHWGEAEHGEQLRGRRCKHGHALSCRGICTPNCEKECTVLWQIKYFDRRNYV